MGPQSATGAGGVEPLLAHPVARKTTKTADRNILMITVNSIKALNEV